MLQLACPPTTIGAASAYLNRSQDNRIPSPNVSSYTDRLFFARRPSKATETTMPRPNPPPTPGSSSDIRGKEGNGSAPMFNLPPTAFQEADRASTASATPSANGSDSSYRPASPTSPADLSRKRSAPQSGPVITKDDFALPPPPTRSRKIIQMKPRDSEQPEPLPAIAAVSPQAAARPQNAPPANGKRKQNNTSTTAAGRKIARKTAHSLIERRRRSKMNEEFGVLKDMIPACKGQEMHKLAILQASIEYLRYLEQCVSDLQAQNNSPRPPPPPASFARSTRDEDEEDEDEEMEDENEGGTGASTPATTAPDRSGSLVSLPSLSQMTSTTTTSPSVFSTTAGRHYSISSTSQASYSPYFHSNQTSPAFGPQLSHAASLPTPFSANRENFGIGSPALKPMDATQHLRQIAEGASDLAEKRRSKHGRSEHELDQEATAALLMLNNDRRNWRASEGEAARSGTGMSVRDLLSG